VNSVRHLDHWGLREPLLAQGAPTESFFTSPIHDEALARLHFLPSAGKRLALLTGPTGTGKSILLAVFARELRRQGTPAVLASLRGRTSAECPAEWGAQLGLRFESDMTPTRQWRLLAEWLAEQRYLEQTTVFLFDDAHEASLEVLSQVQRLLSLGEQGESFTIVLSALRQNATSLGNRLLQCSELHVQLEPWREDDTVDFLRAAMKRCGGRESIFDAAAMKRVHELAAGVPRRVVRLADLALVAGASQELRQIDEATIEQVCAELCPPEPCFEYA
jgi:type II secretory pathway predicted ATPase ExeA